MAVVEYFISGILCIFQNQMECHFFFQERWGMSLSSFPIQPTHSVASKMNGTGHFPGSRGETGRRKSLLHCVLSLPAWPHIAASLITQYLNPLSLGPLQQPAGETSPSLTPVWSPYYTEVKSQGHLIHPCFQETQSVRHGKFAPRASLVFSSPRSHFH